MNEVKLDGLSKDVLKENISILKEIFPEIVLKIKLILKNLSLFQVKILKNLMRDIISLGQVRLKLLKSLKNNQQVHLDRVRKNLRTGILPKIYILKEIIQKFLNYFKSLIIIKLRLFTQILLIIQVKILCIMIIIGIIIRILILR